MEHWIAPMAVFVAGALGGIVNILMSDTGDIQLPGTAANTKGQTVWRPGWMSNVVLGAVAALVSWALYGQDAGKPILGSVPNDLTWANFAASVLVGIGGTRWLSAEVDKNVLKQTAVVAAQKGADPALAATISSGTPAEALKAAVGAQQ